MSYKAAHNDQEKLRKLFTCCLLAILALLACTSSFAQADQKGIFAAAQRHAKLGNFSEAARLYQQNIDLFQDPLSANNLGLYYLNGKGVQQDSYKAIELLKHSIAYGSNRVFKYPGTVETTLGWIYTTGTYPNIAKDPEKARTWTLQAVRYRHPNAHGNLALMYATGFGVEKDYFSALAQLKLGIARYTDQFNWVITDAEEPEWVDAINSEAPVIGQARKFFWLALRTGEKELFIHKITELQVGLLAQTDELKSPGQPAAPRSAVSMGTGFLVREDGILATNAHVIDSCKQISVITNLGPRSAAVLSKDPAQDIAFLKLKDFKAKVFLPLSMSKPKLGEDVLVAGFPFGRAISTDLKLTRGIVSALSGAGDNRSELQVDAAVQPGNSGGPILNSAGSVIAMTASKVDGGSSLKHLGAYAENIAFGVKSRVILGHLSDLELALPKASVESISRDQLVNKLTLTVFRIDCKN
jgi:S1-C subfamily serine protease